MNAELVSYRIIRVHLSEREHVKTSIHVPSFFMTFKWNFSCNKNKREKKHTATFIIDIRDDFV